MRTGLVRKAAAVAVLTVAAGAAVATSATPSAVASTSPGRVTAVAAGSFHTLERHDDGTVWAYGGNESGELGRSANVNATPPSIVANPTAERVVGLSDVVQVAAGGGHSVVLKADGTVWTFGLNRFGQLGRVDNVGTFVANPTPQAVGGITTAVGVAAGGSHTLVLLADGTVRSFGRNDGGQLGTSTNAGTTLPNAAVTGVAGLTDVVAVSAGGTASVAVRADGSVWTWGSNALGALGRADNLGTGTPTPVPAAVPGISTAVDASAGFQHTLVVLADGTVVSFGWNTLGQLGRADGAGTDVPQGPGPVSGLTGIRAVAAGVHASVALASDGSVWMFGGDTEGELGGVGVNNFGFSEQPHVVLLGADRIATNNADGDASMFGSSHLVVALRTDGTVWGWGNGTEGQLGGAVSGIQSLPTPIGRAARVPSAPTVFHAIAVTRVLDTRVPGSVIPDKPRSLIPVTIPVTVVPQGATAVVVNVTATEADGPGYVQVVPGDAPAGATSTLNIERAGQTVANSAIVPLGADRTVTLYVQNSAHLVLDVAGYFSRADRAVSAGRLQLVTPTRLLDTRAAAPIGSSGIKPAAGAITRVVVAGAGTEHAGAAVVNVTATEATAPGFVQVAPAGALVPGATSSLNVERVGQTVANLVVMPLGAGGALDVYTQSGTDLVVDLVAVFTDDSAPASTAGRFVAMDPQRALDTRPDTAIGYGGPRPGADALVPARAPSVVGAAAIATNLTATEAAAPGYVQAGARGLLVPGATSSLNVERAGQTVANAAVVASAGGGAFDLYTQTGTHLVADVTGWFTAAVPG